MHTDLNAYMAQECPVNMDEAEVMLELQSQSYGEALTQVHQQLATATQNHLYLAGQVLYLKTALSYKTYQIERLVELNTCLIAELKKRNEDAMEIVF